MLLKFLEDPSTRAQITRVICLRGWSLNCLSFIVFQFILHSQPIRVQLWILLSIYLFINFIFNLISFSRPLGKEKKKCWNCMAHTTLIHLSNMIIYVKHKLESTSMMRQGYYKLINLCILTLHNSLLLPAVLPCIWQRQFCCFWIMCLASSYLSTFVHKTSLTAVSGLITFGNGHLLQHLFHMRVTGMSWIQTRRAASSW